MNSLARIASMVFGILMLVLSVAVTIETVVRKLFSISLGGVDELSGYAIAVGAPLAFAIAAIDRAHIRINIFHMRLGLRTRAVLNAVAAATMAGLRATCSTSPGGRFPKPPNTSPSPRLPGRPR